ncbi:MAG: MarR family transcriptional regulator [Nocardioidaceae bacterium]|nr:MarR family transcriptional regulator [Nocardioidaceae bacterium]
MPQKTVSVSATRAAHELRVAVGRLRRRFRELHDPSELSPSATSVLSRLSKDGPATASELATAERVRPQSVAAVLATLDGQGLIERRRDPGDGRRQLVSLSPAGRELVTDRRRAGEEWLARALQDHFTEAERRTLLEATALLERLSGA